MTSEEVEPTQKNKTVPEPPSTFSSLPDEITENILARVSRWNYPSLSLVSKRFHSLLSSVQIYKTRSQIGADETCVYVLLRYPGYPYVRWFRLRTKPNDQNRTKRRGKIRFKRDSSGFSVVPIPSSSTHSFLDRLYIENFGSDMYIIGGPYKEPSTSVRIFDCRSHTWRDSPTVTVARENAHTVLHSKSDSIYAAYEMGNVVYGCTYYGCLMWSEVEGREWREIKGLEKLSEHPTRGLKTGRRFGLGDFGGQLLVMWDPYPIKRSNTIWYAKISLESRACNGREMWGKVECVDVLTFPGESYEWFRCITAFV